MSFLGKKLLALRSRGKKKQREENTKLDFESSKHIGIIYTWESKEKRELIERFQQKLANEEKELSVLCFNPSKNPIDCPHPHFNVEAISNFGKIKSIEVDHWLEKQFDYLVLIDFNTSEIIEFLIYHANAFYKVSAASAVSNMEIDLMLDVNMNAGYEQYLAQIIEYIKIIKYE